MSNNVTRISSRIVSGCRGSFFEAPVAGDGDCWDVHDALSRARDGFRRCFDVTWPERLRNGSCPGVSVSGCRMGGRDHGGRAFLSDLATRKLSSSSIVPEPHCNGGRTRQR